MTEVPNHQRQKLEYYTRDDVVQVYQSSRFGRPAGRWIREIEERAIISLLDRCRLHAGSSAIDLATGTGRNIALLERGGAEITACDLSVPMLQVAREPARGRCVACNAAQIPLAAERFDCVLASRFFFHFDDLTGFMAEIARVLKPGGHLVFDVCNWTPRTWIPGKQDWLGGRMFLHPRRRVERLAQATGFEIQDQVGAFGMPPFLYQHLPLWMVKCIELASTVMLLGYRNKVYYLLRKRVAGTASTPLP